MSLPHLNYDSLVLMTIMNLFTTGCVMIFIWNADRPGPGLTRFAVGDLLIGAGLILAALTKAGPAGAIALAAALSIHAGAISMYSGLRAFRGFPPVPTPLLAGASAVYTCFVSYWFLIRHDPAARVAFISSWMAVILILMMVVMLAELPREDRRLYLFMAALFGLHAMTMAIRSAWAITHRTSTDFFDGSPANFTAMLTLNFVVTGCGIATAIASSRKLYHDTRRLALHDPLTHLPNRRMLEQRLAEVRRTRYGVWPPVALIYLDLDNFKTINDTFGHHGGDKVLQVFAERLRSREQEGRFPARLGGDEFVILAEGVRSRAEASALMERIVRDLQEQMTIDGQTVSVAVSCGLALYPEDAKCLTELMKAADRSMYRAKRGERAFGAFPDTRLEGYPKTAA
jgi:diguanylate cyclase (GGDEF)-like protein